MATIFLGGVVAGSWLSLTQYGIQVFDTNSLTALATAALTFLTAWYSLELHLERRDRQLAEAATRQQRQQSDMLSALSRGYRALNISIDSSDSINHIRTRQLGADVLAMSHFVADPEDGEALMLRDQVRIVGVQLIAAADGPGSTIRIAALEASGLRDRVGEFLANRFRLPDQHASSAD